MTDIISPLPFTLENGTTADATQVMADLNEIRNDVNSNDYPTQPSGTNNNTVATTAFVKDAVNMANNYKGAALFQDGDAALPNGSSTLVFSNLSADTNSISSGGSTFTVPVGTNIIRILCGIIIETANTSLTLYKNGSPFISGITLGGTGQIGISLPFAVTAGDVFLINAVQSSGAGPLRSESYFEMQLIG